MIKITCTKKPSVEYTFLTGKSYSVGRKACDLTFADDQSVSRNHATILIDHPLANISNSSLCPSIVITDLGSKFGTFINDGIEASRKVAMREPNILSDGDRFRFGLQWNEFKISYTPVIATSSQIIGDAQLLKKTICQLGAHLLPEWKAGCGFVITEALTLTVKAVCAILSAKYIVVPKYFHDYLEAVTNKTKLPNPTEYLPLLKERLKRPYSFEPDKSRSKLFAGKIFLFQTQKQVKKISVALACAGGSTDIITAVSETLLKSPDTLVISSATDNAIVDAGMTAAIDLYRSTQKRIVPESEIGLAAIYSSTDEYCNPFVNAPPRFGDTPLISQTQQSSASSSLLSLSRVPETQTSTAETQRSDFSFSVPSSRRIADDSILSSQSREPEPEGPTVDPDPGVYRPLVFLSQEEGSQPMEFEVPTPRIKAEKGTAESTTKRRDDDETSSTNKRRRGRRSPSFDDAARSSPDPVRREPSPKRLRSDPKLNDSRSSTQNDKILSSIFNMSDDDDDDPMPPPPTRTTRSAAAASATKNLIQIPLEREEQLEDLNIIPSTPEVIDATNDSIASPSHSPVKHEKDRGNKEKSKRKEPVDEHTDIEPNTSKKRRVDKNTNRMDRSSSIEEKREPVFISVAKNEQAPLRSSLRKDEHIPEEDIKPLPFRFAPLVKQNQRPVQEAHPVPDQNGARSVFNFKCFKKVLPLCQNSEIMNNAPQNCNSSRINTSIHLRGYNSMGFTDSEPVVVNSRAKAESPVVKQKRNDNKRTEPPPVIEISPASRTTSPIRRSARNNRRDTASATSSAASSPTKSTQNSSRRTRSNRKRPESSPEFLMEEEAEQNAFDPPRADDEWAF